MQLDYEKTQCFKVKGITFTLASSWNGLEEWRDEQGRKLIVARDSGCGFASAFGDIFGDMFPSKYQVGKIAVLSGSPDLLAQLAEVKL
jgi:hypothetical protein